MHSCPIPNGGSRLVRGVRPLACFVLGCLTVVDASAMPTIAITSPADLQLIVPADLDPNGDLLVTGYIYDNDPVLPFQGYDIVVNGILPAQGDIVLTADGATFEVLIPFSPPAPQIPETNILRPLVAALEDASAQVVSLSKITVLDNTRGSTRRVPAPAVLWDEVDAQLAKTGVEKLSPLLTSALPLSEADALNVDLTTTTDALAVESHFNAPRLCVPVTETSLDYAALSDFAAVRNEANVQWRIFREIKRAFLANPNPVTIAAFSNALITSCVQHRPEDKDFLICSDRIDSEPMAMTAGSVELATLSLDAPEPQALHSNVRLETMDAAVDLHLRGLSLRWDGGPITCIVRPVKEIDDSVAGSDPDLAAWSLCAATEVDAASSESVGGMDFSILPDALDAEMNTVSRERPAGFVLLGPTVNASYGTCAEAWANGAAEDALLDRIGDLEDAVGDAWDLGASATMEALAIDDVMSIFETGGTSVCGLDYGMRYTNIRAVTNESIRFLWHTSADPDPVVALPPTMLHEVPDGREFSEDGIGEDGSPFDVSYRVTTGSLNQILRVRAAQELFGRRLEPTWAELGLGVPAGASPDDPAILNAAVLRRLIPGIAVDRRDTFTLDLRPGQAPFTYMPEDPQQTPLGAPAVGYQVGSLGIAVRLHNAKGRSMDLLTIKADMFAPLGIDFGPSGSPYLDIQMQGGNRLGFTLATSRVAGCPFSSPAQIPGGKGCTDDLLAPFEAFLGPMLGRKLERMLDQVPAPQIFDAEGAIPRYLYVPARSRRWDDRQNIILYSTFSPTIGDEVVVPPPICEL